MFAGVFQSCPLADRCHHEVFAEVLGGFPYVVKNWSLFFQFRLDFLNLRPCPITPPVTKRLANIGELLKIFVGFILQVLTFLQPCFNSCLPLSFPLCRSFLSVFTPFLYCFLRRLVFRECVAVHSQQILLIFLLNLTVHINDFIDLKRVCTVGLHSLRPLSGSRFPDAHSSLQLAFLNGVQSFLCCL